MSIDERRVRTEPSHGGTESASARSRPHDHEPAAPRIVAIVPVHDGGDALRRSLAGLIGAGQPPRDILVMDDASRDGAALAAARALGTRHERLGEVSGGPARARNAGARLAAADEADAFLFVDADVVLHEDALERVRDRLRRHPDIDALFGSYDDAPPAPGWVSQYKNLFHHWTHQRGAGDVCTFWSGCGVIRREAFVALGGFDERYTDASVEDVDLGLRLSDAGYRISLCPDILCTHLKDWRLRGWLATDILRRALPWSRLLLERGRGVPDGLNLGHRERISALLALLIAASLATLPLSSSGAGLTFGLSLAGFALLQRDLLGFFARRRGVPFALAATAMHVVYFISSSAVFVAVHLGLLRRGRTRPGAFEHG